MNPFVREFLQTDKYRITLELKVGAITVMDMVIKVMEITESSGSEYKLGYSLDMCMDILNQCNITKYSLTEIKNMIENLIAITNGYTTINKNKSKKSWCICS